MAARDQLSIEITPQVLLKAYSCGIFPMAESADDPALYWIEPQQRGVLPLSTIHLSSRLAQTIRNTPLQVRIDTNFHGVIDGCAASRPGRRTTWINSRIRSLYGSQTIPVLKDEITLTAISNSAGERIKSDSENAFGKQILHYVLGEHTLFIGDSNQVSRVVGIDVDREKIKLFTLMGFLAACAAIMLTLENKNFFGNQGQGYLLTAIASVLIGGTSIFGGSCLFRYLVAGAVRRKNE